VFYVVLWGIYIHPTLDIKQMEEALHERCCHSDGASKLNDAAVADLLEFLRIDVELEPAASADREQTSCSVRE